MALDAAKTAVIFDVDGPLLRLSGAEEDVFFEPLEEIYGLRRLSRDWNSYRIRNDCEIFREVLTDHLNRPPDRAEMDAVAARYIDCLQRRIADGTASVTAVPGACDLVTGLTRVEGLSLGIATANLGAAAKMRLARAGLWAPLSGLVGSAEHGGPKASILASVLKRLDTEPRHIVFIGDNLNDLAAAQETGTHFIGFGETREARNRLHDAGATHVCGDHKKSRQLIASLLRIDGV